MPARIRVLVDTRLLTVEVRSGGVAFDDPPAAIGPRRASTGPRIEGGPSGTLEAVAAIAGDRIWIGIGGDVFECHLVPAGDEAVAARDADALSSPMPATVVTLHVQPGARVRRGQVLVALEAMKMELPLRAPRDGVVLAVRCREGELVSPGVPLIELGSPPDRPRRGGR